MVIRDPLVHIIIIVPFIIILATTATAQVRFDELLQDIETAQKCYAVDVNPSVLSMNNPDKEHRECYRSQLPIVCAKQSGSITGLWDIGESQTGTNPDTCGTKIAAELYRNINSLTIATADIPYTVISSVRCWASHAIVFAGWAMQGQLAWALTNTIIENATNITSITNYTNDTNSKDMWYSKIAEKIHVINHRNMTEILDALTVPKQKYAAYRKYDDADELWNKIPSTLIVRYCRNISETEDSGCELNNGVPVSVVEISHAIGSPSKVWLGVKTPRIEQGKNLTSDLTVMDNNGNNVNDKIWEAAKNAILEYSERSGTYNTFWKPFNDTPRGYIWWKVCSSYNNGSFWKVGDYMSNCRLVTGQQGYMDGSIASVAGYRTAALTSMTKYIRDSCIKAPCINSKNSKCCLCMELWIICWEYDAALAILTGLWAALVTAGAALVAWILHILIYVVIKTIEAYKETVFTVLPAVVQPIPVSAPAPAPAPESENLGPVVHSTIEINNPLPTGTHSAAVPNNRKSAPVASTTEDKSIKFKRKKTL